MYSIMLGIYYILSSLIFTRILCGKPYFFTLQMAQQRLRKTKQTAQSHMVSKRQRKKLNSDLPNSKALSILTHYAIPSYSHYHTKHYYVANHVAGA